MKGKNILILVVFVLFFSCEKKEEIDTEKPEIDLDIQDAFPIQCDTLYFGESFILKVRFTDNVELGSYNIDIHHNFDHHSHSYTIEECNLAPIKEPGNPFVFIEDYPVPDGESDYTTNLSIKIPTQNNEGQFDEGDYHFHINLSDKEGWSIPFGMSIKFLYR